MMTQNVESDIAVIMCDPGEMKLNPLFVPMILKEILSCLPFGTLKTVKLVCKLWSEEAHKLLPAKGKICLSSNEQVEQFASMNTSLGTSAFEKSQQRQVNFYRFLLKKAEDVSFSLGSLQLQNFFHQNGAKIRYLELEEGTWTIKSLKNVLFNETPNLEYFGLTGVVPFRSTLGIKSWDTEQINASGNSLRITFPKLTTLSLNLTHQPDAQFSSIVPFIVDLLYGVPNLERIVCRSSKGFELTLFSILFEHDIPLTRLSHIDMPLELNEGEIRRLHMKSYPLRSIRFKLRPGLRHPCLYSFLSSVGSTLDTLSIHMALIPRDPERFPCSTDLKNLKHLSLEMFYGSLNFIHDLIHLESLTLIKVNLSTAFRDDHDEFNKPHEALKSFKVFDSSSNAGRFSFADIYRTVVNLFPKLKTLRLDYIWDTAMKMILNGLPLLEEFIAINGIYTDEAVTGIPNGASMVAEQNLKTDSEQLKRNPGIVDLKNLRHLQLQSPRITDASITMGVLLCKEIKILSLTSAMITDSALKKIVDEMDLNQLTMSSCYQISQDMKEYTKHALETRGRTVHFK